MGASLPPRENRFRALGLVPGLTLRIDVAKGERVESYSTRVEEVHGEELAVLMPMARLMRRAFPAGTNVRASYLFRGKPYAFHSVATGTDGEHQLLKMPDRIESRDRRRAFRLPTSIEPKAAYRLVVDPELASEGETIEFPCTVVDLSEGGVCLSTRAGLALGQWLGLQLQLPGSREIQPRMKVVSVDPPAPGNLKYRIHCIFQGLSRPERDAIARFLIARQLEMRRAGQL